MLNAERREINKKKVKGRVSFITASLGSTYMRTQGSQYGL